MKRLLQLMILAAFVTSFGSNATATKTKHCVTKRNANNELVTTCDGKIVPNHDVERHRKCTTTTSPTGKKVTKCTGKTVRKSH